MTASHIRRCLAPFGGPLETGRLHMVVIGPHPDTAPARIQKAVVGPRVVGPSHEHAERLGATLAAAALM